MLPFSKRLRCGPVGVPQKVWIADAVNFINNVRRLSAVLIVLVLINRVIAGTAISAATEMLGQVLPIMEMHAFFAGGVMATIASLLS